MSRDEFRLRASRARALAKRHPEAREILSFYAELALFQSRVDPDLSSLLQLVEKKAPEPLRTAAIDEAACRRATERLLSGKGLESKESFFARVLLQASTAPAACPGHGVFPQAGCLRPEGNGTTLTLVCSICLGEWPHARGTCFGCGESDEKVVTYYEAAELPSIRVQMCERCRHYLHIVRLDVDPLAIPDVDEMAALSLDVWARERGYRKLVPNLVGI
jgi:FdhE protein